MTLLRILVVEDNSHVRELLSYALRAGASSFLPAPDDALEIDAARDGQEALTVLGRLQISLLITDINLPVLNGNELIRRLRAASPSGPPRILAISASASDAREEALAAGADLFLQKPVRHAELLDAVRQLLRVGAG